MELSKKKKEKRELFPPSDKASSKIYNKVQPYTIESVREAQGLRGQ